MDAVLYIDDQEEELETLRYQLGDKYRVTLCNDGRAAAAQVSRRRPDAVVLDIEMPGYDGFRVLADIRALPNPPPVLMLSGYAEPFFVVRALKEGAADFLSKPYSGAMVRYRIAQLLREGTRTSIRNTTGTAAIEAAGAEAVAKTYLAGSSAAMRELRRTLALYARSDAAVLILGESGTGKDLAARVLHRLSGRAAGPFVVRNVAALTETLVESELFGCEDGAYTSARKRAGCFESANGGTLFLDEIADAGPGVQASLLRVVEDGLVRRIGANDSRQIDCRTVFATNKDLDALAATGGFRHDLLYRINTLPVVMPSLGKRLEDIPELVREFLERAGRSPESISAAALDDLMTRAWPGNVRQLKACIARAAVLAEGGTIRPEHLR